MTWDEVYAVDGFVYGKEPNDFLRGQVDRLKPGRILCLGEGEGRNAVYLAAQGNAVTAVDSSRVGLAKMGVLAGERGVRIETVRADLADFPIVPHAWDSIVSIFCHLPPTLRARVHRQVVVGLKPGGVFLLEGYTPDQLARGTGGPRSLELLVDLSTLRRELAGLDLRWGRELVREVREGSKHTGLGAVVQILAVKPAEAQPSHSP